MGAALRGDAGPAIAGRSIRGYRALYERRLAQMPSVSTNSPSPQSVDSGPSSTPSEAASPLFIVGSPRSGTSALVDALFAGGYKGFREGNLLGLLKPLYDQIDEFFCRPFAANERTLVGNARRDIIRRGVREIFKRELEELNDKTPWLDKTGNPETILVVPALIEMWPNCRIIFARRRAIENIQSRLKKFPEREFTYHCRDWARNMSAWRRVREGLDAWRYIEVDQRDMVVKPDAVAQAIASMLRLDEKARGKIEAKLRTARAQQTAPGTTERVTSVSETSWTPAEIAEFMKICGPEMEAYGYSADRAYWKETVG